MKEMDVASGDLQECVGVLSYVYDHEARDLARRLTQSHHHHHEISAASLHVHLDADRCLEVSILKDRTMPVRDFADTIVSQKAVMQGDLKIVLERFS